MLTTWPLCQDALVNRKLSHRVASLLHRVASYILHFCQQWSIRNRIQSYANSYGQKKNLGFLKKPLPPLRLGGEAHWPGPNMPPLHAYLPFPGSTPRSYLIHQVCQFECVPLVRQGPLSLLPRKKWWWQKRESAGNLGHILTAVSACTLLPGG